MNINEEIALHSRYIGVFNSDSKSIVSTTSVHLAQQLAPYINPNLDLGWVIRCILDINSGNLFSNVRSKEQTEVEDNTIHPEYKFAQLIVNISELLYYEYFKIELCQEELAKYKLDESSAFYYGNHLTNLNNTLVDLVALVATQIVGEG